MTFLPTEAVDGGFPVLLFTAAGEKLVTYQYYPIKVGGGRIINYRYMVTTVLWVFHVCFNV